MRIVRFALAVLLTGCASMTGAPRLVDDAVLERAASLDDSTLLADVEALHDKNFKPGSGEQHAGLCLQQYVRGRTAEVQMAKASDDYARRVAQSEMMSGYATCAVQCKYAVEQMPSQYTPIAAKYVAPCEAGSAGTQESIATEKLERVVEELRKGTQPLELFFAHKDATEIIEYLRKEGMAGPDVERLATEVESLEATHAEAIGKGRAFFHSAPAQENFQLRAENEAQQDAVAAQMDRLEAERDEAIDAGLLERAQNLKTEYAAQEVLLARLVARHAALKAQYEKMAVDAGVYAQ